jgi:subtilisin
LLSIRFIALVTISLPASIQPQEFNNFLEYINGENPMLKRLTFLTLIAIFMLALLGVAKPAAAAAAAAPARLIKGQYIVVFKANISDVDGTVDRVSRGRGLGILQRYHKVLKGFAATIPDAMLPLIEKSPYVDYVVPDQEVQAVGALVPVKSGETVPTGVRRMGADSLTQAHQASAVNVAVIDTGINLTSPDLNAVSGKNCVRSTRTAADDNGHGSHVSGTIAAKDTGSGVVGVAPGTKLYAVKVLNSMGSGSWSQVICGIDWVTTNAAALNIKVASMSLGGTGSNDNNCGNTNKDVLHQAICRSTAAGVTYVVAAGNSTANLDTFVPAAYPEVLAVTAMTDSDGLAGAKGAPPACRTTEKDDTFASFSNYAVSATAINHTVAAPGVCILSDWKTTGTNTISGTSMATPHVSGTVALCFGNGGVAGPCAGMTPAQVIQKIRADAQANATAANGFAGDPNHAVTGKYFGFLVSAGGY